MSQVQKKQPEKKMNATSTAVCAAVPKPIVVNQVKESTKVSATPSAVRNNDFDYPRLECPENTLALTPVRYHPRQYAKTLSGCSSEMRETVLKSMSGFQAQDPMTVKVRLPITPQAVSSNGAGQVQVVYGIQYTSIAGISDWANVFKEYRFVFAEILFTPSGTPVLSAADASFGAGINYSTNITAPGSLSEVLTLDQGKVVGLGLPKSTKWHCNFEKLFGEVWTDTGTNVVYGTWKAFNTATGNPLSVQLGNWWGYVDCEFRGLG